MQIKKTYYGINPELLFDEIKDFVQKQGATVDESKLETYSLPTDSSSFISRGTLTFKTGGEGKECVRAHLIGSSKTEVKLILDINEELFPASSISALTDDIDFVFGSYEKKPR
jgi:hypothetical protein